MVIATLTPAGAVIAVGGDLLQMDDPWTLAFCVGPCSVEGETRSGNVAWSIVSRMAH